MDGMSSLESLSKDDIPSDIELNYMRTNKRGFYI